MGPNRVERELLTQSMHVRVELNVEDGKKRPSTKEKQAGSGMNDVANQMTSFATYPIEANMYG